MAISNVGSNSRPGVCTSTTRPSAPFEGQMIYETDTNRVLIWDNAAWVMIADTDQPPGLQLIKTQTVGTGVSSVTVTDAFSSSYDNYKIVVDNLIISAASGFTLKLGATATNYYWSGVVVQYSTGSLSGEFGNNAAVFAGGVVADTSGVSGTQIEIFRPFLACRTTYTAHGIDSRTGGSGTRTYSGFLDNTTSYTAFTMTTTAGTVTSGTIRVYGYRN